MDARARAVELCEEHDLHVVCVSLRGNVPAELRGRMLTEATAEARALLDAEERPVWWAEADDDATLLVVDALAMDLKQRLVDLEDVHPLGAWFNLDLVTEMPDGTRSAWHHSPMRPEPRLLPTLGLEDALDGYDWS